jgi:hypothetical protein
VKITFGLLSAAIVSASLPASTFSPEQVFAGPSFAVAALEASPPRAVLDLQSFAVYALSRGSGLSETGRRAIAEFREVLRAMKADGRVVQVSDTRIGIEGETRICAKFATAELAGQQWMEMTRYVGEANLVQLKAEEC